MDINELKYRLFFMSVIVSRLCEFHGTKGAEVFLSVAQNRYNPETFHMLKSLAEFHDIGEAELNQVLDEWEKDLPGWPPKRGK